MALWICRISEAENCCFKRDLMYAKEALSVLFCTNMMQKYKELSIF